MAPPPTRGQEQPQRGHSANVWVKSSWIFGVFAWRVGCHRAQRSEIAAEVGINRQKEGKSFSTGQRRDGRDRAKVLKAVRIDRNQEASNRHQRTAAQTPEDLLARKEENENSCRPVLFWNSENGFFLLFGRCIRYCHVSQAIKSTMETILIDTHQVSIDVT